MGMPVSSIALIKPLAVSVAMKSKCGVPPRMMAPSATTASTPRVSASARAASGSSNDPGTHSTGTLVAPLAVKHSIAPSTSRSVSSWLKRAATIAKRSPDASRGSSGGFIRPDNRLSPGNQVVQIEIVSELFLLGPQVRDVVLRCERLERDGLSDRKAVALQARALRRVVGQESHRFHSEVHKDLCSDAIVTWVRGEA